MEDKVNKLTLSYDKVADLISETVYRTLLKEQVSPMIWHFTYFDALISILEQNALKFQKAYANHYDLPGITGYTSKRPYYLCTTRSRSSFDGYSRTLYDDNDEGYARIELDGDKLNSIVHAKASDYFGTREDDNEDFPYGKRNFYKELEKGRNKLYYNTIQDYYKDSEDIKSNEKEDTLWYNKPYLHNANKYIRRIDIVILSEKFFMKNEAKFHRIKEMGDKLGIPIYFYNNVSDFDKQI